MSLPIYANRYGEIPWHYAIQDDLLGYSIGAGHTMAELHARGFSYADMRWLPAGHALHQDGTLQQWARPLEIQPNDHDRETAAAIIRMLLDSSCKVASDPADTTAGLLLSGGIDSSAVAVGLLSHGVPLRAYTAVHNPKSPDLKAARMVASHLGLELVEVPVPVPSMEEIRETLRIIEMPWKAQVEIGWPCHLLGQAMAADGITVAYSGEGSDELWASHNFAFYERRRPGALGWHDYRWEDFSKQATRNFAREWKVYNHHGIEIQMPFISQPLIEYILALPEETCRDSDWHAKRPLQAAYADDLPGWITQRQKTGFQDALGIKPSIASTYGLTQRWVGSLYLAEYRKLFPGAKP